MTCFPMMREPSQNDYMPESPISLMSIHFFHPIANTSHETSRLCAFR